MTKELIPYNTIDFLSKTMRDYLSGEDALRPFYGTYPVLDGILRLASEQKFIKEKRKVLLNALQNQYAASDLTLKEQEHLEKLSHENCFTVTTGHQICLLGGPLYFFLKIVSTINLSKLLNEESNELKFVPVFWMATEDHDFDEINHVHLFGKKISWEREKGNAVGRMSMDGIEKFREQLFSMLGENEHANEIKSLFESAYENSSNLAEATRKFVRYFFKDEGLLIIDGDDSGLKQSFFEPLKSELLSQQVKEVVSSTIDSLKGSYKIQANPADVNLFYLDKEQRTKIKRENGQFQLGQDRLSIDKLIKTAADHPERFSPNVLMRPLYQEFILPNVAYVGGGGELAYWLELKALFELNNMNLPCLVLRNSVLWIDKKSAKTIDDLEITVEDLFEKEHNLISKYASSLLNDNVNIAVELERLKALFELLEYKAKAIDPSLVHTAKAQYIAAEKSIKKLEQKMVKAIKLKNETTLNKLKKVKQKLFPNGNLQERHESFIPFYIEYGMKFIDVLKESLDPLDFQLTILKDQ